MPARKETKAMTPTVAGRMGDPEMAMQFYREALKIAPDEPTALANMGLPLALAKQPPATGRALRQAAGSPKANATVRSDLALVPAPESKDAGAEHVGAAGRGARRRPGDPAHGRSRRGPRIPEKGST
jgi:Tfp pilus assembly protein PilF